LPDRRRDFDAIVRTMPPPPPLPDVTDAVAIGDAQAADGPLHPNADRC
jgi:hypothetical protein